MQNTRKVFNMVWKQAVKDRYVLPKDKAAVFAIVDTVVKMMKYVKCSHANKPGCKKHGGKNCEHRDYHLPNSVCIGNYGPCYNESTGDVLFKIVKCS